LLGEARGKNWWCLMFPPLCIADLNGATIDDKGSEAGGSVPDGADAAQNEHAEESRETVEPDAGAQACQTDGRVHFRSLIAEFWHSLSDKGPTRNGVPCETANETVTPKTLPINEIQEIFDMKQLKKIAAAVLIAAMLGLLLPQLGVNAEALKRGSRGDLVRQLQTRLRSWGYYSGTVDGVYGAKTESAVRAFQKRNGLTADGIVGQKTAAALGLNLPSSTGGGSAASSNGNLYLLARLVHGEARGEPYKGKVAVAAVVLNRVRSASFPNTIAGVIYQSGAFDAVSDGQINLAPDDESIRAARDAMNGWDPSNGCLYYYNPATATSRWMLSRPVLLRIGAHAFC
jgi:N-acetylmuramoyl-L-alanine amidase